MNDSCQSTRKANSFNIYLGDHAIGSSNRLNHFGLSLRSTLPPTLVTTDESDDNEVSYGVAPQNRYCTDCEIQFNSFKTFKVRLFLCVTISSH